MKRFVRLMLILSLTMLISITNSSILSRKITLPTNYELSNTLMDRNLRDAQEKAIKEKRVKIDTHLSKMERKLKFLQIVQGIVQKAKKENLDIKSIKLGSDVMKIFKEKDLKQELGKYVNDPSLDKKVAKLEKEVQNLHRNTVQAKYPSRRLGLRPGFRVPPPRKLPKKGMMKGLGGKAMGGAKGGAAGGANNMNFQFLPGIAGVPFPPMMMNGPHYHPPISVTVNSIPNPNPRSSLNPFEIEQSNLTKQVQELGKIKGDLSRLNDSLKLIDEDVETNLNDKYQRVLEIGN